jgi:anthranilate synthase/aminodeoxychorismate synthase-like glutamine amidotransferase
LHVARNDRTTIKEIEKMQPDHIVISPGPKTPKEAGITCDVIDHFKGKVPIFGVCLGHQAIGHVFGARVILAPEIVHGKTTEIFHERRGIYRGLPMPFCATRYHSLIVSEKRLPSCLEVTAWTKSGLIMGLRHREYPVEGVQFHPESILTKYGRKILKNFIECCRISINDPNQT